jgi:uncharacterized protein YecA (UPF0149 family)
MVKLNRNTRYSCGSGKKYKNCCLRNEAEGGGESALGPLILEASLRGLEHSRHERDEAEKTLLQLVNAPRATADDNLNVSLSIA